MVNYECVWYNGEFGTYEILEFNPDGLNEKQIIEKAIKCLDEKGIYGDDVDKALQTLYLLDVDCLKCLKGELNKNGTRNKIK